MRKKFNNINAFFVLFILFVIIFFIHIDIILAPLGKYASGFEITDLIYYINIRQYVVDRILHFIFPLWTTKLFCGVPFFANSECAVLYLPNIVFYFLPISKAINFSYLLHFFILAFSSFLWINNRIKDKLISIIVSLISIFGTNLYLHFAAGHLSNVITACWFPILLYFYDKSFKEKKYFYIFPASFIISLQIFAGHFQYVYYTALVSFIYVLFFCRNRYAIVTIISSYIISVFLTAIQLLPSYCFYIEGARKINIFDTNATSIYSSFKYLLSFLFYIQAYLDDLFWETSNYIGTISFIVVLLALFHIHNKNILKFIVVVVFLLSLTFKPIAETIGKIIPFFSWFRGPVKLNFFINIMLLPILAYGVNIFLSEKFKINRIFIIFLFVISGSIILFRENILNLLLVGVALDNNVINVVKYSIKITALLIFFFSISLCFKKYKIVKIILILMLLAEPIIVVRTHLCPLFLKQDFKYEYITKESFNVQPRFSAYKNFNLLYDAENVSGLYSDRLRNFGILNKKSGDIKSENILELLRWKYTVDLITGSVRKTENKTLNRINIYYKYQIETKKENIYEILSSKNFNIFENIILEKEPKYQPTVKGEYDLNFLHFDENSIEFECKTTEPAIILYTDNYAKGWKAYNVDNPKQKYDIICADYIYKAISVDKGYHKIRFEYKPMSFVIGMWLSIVSWIIFVFSFIILKYKK